MEPITLFALLGCYLIFGVTSLLSHWHRSACDAEEKRRNDGKKVLEYFWTKYESTRTRTRKTRDVVGQGNVDVMQLLNGKCIDKAPNCIQELCQKYHISLHKKCKKTCGVCDPMMKVITWNPKANKRLFV